MTFPPGPALPADKLTEIFASNPFPFLRECREKYGDMFTLELGDFGQPEFGANGKWVFLSHPQQVKQLYSADPAIIHAGEANNLQFLKLLPSSCSTLLDDDAHVVRRNFLAVPFQNIPQHIPGIASVVSEVIGTLPDEGPFPLFHYMKIIARNTILRTVFGVTDEADLESIGEELIRFESQTTTHDERREIVAVLDRYLREKIPQRREQGQREGDTDIFSYMVFTKDKSGEHLSDLQLRDELINLLIGGVGTTSTMCSWAFAWILSHPEAYARVTEELRANLEGGTPLTEERFKRLEYLDAAVTEALRITPFLFNSSLRLLKGELRIGDYLLPADTLVANCSYLLHMNPEIYPEPERFRPERFLESRPNPFRWAPFGGGARRCVGHAFATQEIKVILALVLSAVELELLEPATEPEFQGVFYGPSAGVVVRIAKRL